MFTVIYTFRVKGGQEEAFQQSWAHITERHMGTRGSLGGRLHRDQNGAFVAIAPWPGRRRWEAPGPPDTPALAAARTTMGDACEEIRTSYELEVVQDLWQCTS